MNTAADLVDRSVSETLTYNPWNKVKRLDARAAQACRLHTVQVDDLKAADMALMLGKHSLSREGGQRVRQQLVEVW